MEYQIIPMTPAQLPQAAALERACFSHPWTEQALAEAALARVGIPELADRPLKRLSGGQRQKVYLAMLLCQDSPVMLLDEPTTYLDIGCQLETWQLCRDLAAQGRTVVAVSHDIGQSLRYGHRVLLVEQGRLRMDAGPQEAAASGELERVCSRILTLEAGRPVPEEGSPCPD